MTTERLIGVTMSWGMTPTKEFECTARCACGDTQPDRYIYFRGAKDGTLNDNGWPVDQQGKQYPASPR